jgi:hypothetical protein
MAVEETEYFSLNQGNGLSPLDRPVKKGTAKKAKAANSAKDSRLRPFLQGITVGTVLLIPVGVWCWVRADLPQAGPVVEESRPSAGKSSKQAASKRKPVKVRPASTATRLPAGVQSSQPLAARPTITVVDSDPPPFIPPAAQAPVATPQAELAPTTAGGEDLQSGGGEQKPKKNLWKTITAPFRGKNKDRQAATANDPIPPVQ